ncbi:MAG: nuclear transport factor 2 family protein [Austwickia sp.]|jgi:ketosteroid isomerase-like protein|nr:MAG: nuclear transport factor 2 family protein [Austwickia sp.]
MSSQRTPDDPRKTVQRYYDALDRDDLEAVLELFSGDVLYRRPGYEVIAGMDRLRDYYSGDRKLAAGRHLVRDVLVEGQKAAAHGMYEGQLKDGDRTAMGFAAFFSFDMNGRIAEHTTYFFTPAV